MRANDPNLPQLRSIALALGELREQVVFVGGAVAGLLVTDRLADAMRATRRRDLPLGAPGVGAAVRPDARAARGAGLHQPLVSVGGANGHGHDGGPGRRHHDPAGERGGVCGHQAGGFVSRGGGDFLSSHDLEDALNIVDGREELMQEMSQAPAEVRQAVAAAFAPLLANRDFANVLPGLVAEPERAGLVMARLRAMAA